MKRRELHLDLLHSGKYRQQVVKARKGKGAYTRSAKHKKPRSQHDGAFFMAFAISIAVSPKNGIGFFF